MIEQKKFESLDKLNEFVSDNNVKVINIETRQESYNTGLPLPKGGSFISTRECFNLFYSK